ncbi:hypothetical protein FU781_06065 [Campylobacter coli]|nr:hypothetical protein [Campylobacter coli]EEO8733960.1 hypothetical protein [Campylobacter coli]
MSLGDDFWDQLKVIEKKFPQVLSNGCKYYRNDYNYDVKDPDYDFNFDDKPDLHTMKINLKHIWVKKTIKN